MHPGYFNKPRQKFDYETNIKSTAYIGPNEGSNYFAGGINGGETKYFLNLIKLLNQNIVKDKQNRIIAKWHDESHWNWYLNKHIESVKILSPSYLYYSELKLPFPPKIILRDKKKLGGHSNFRGKIEMRLVINSIKDFIKKLIKKI